jgi:hypothetical protein
MAFAGKFQSSTFLKIMLRTIPHFGTGASSTPAGRIDQVHKTPLSLDITYFGLVL